MAARLSSPSLGTELTLGIAGYQFPEMQQDPWDSNWLMLDVSVATKERNWSRRDACLTTFEVKTLIDTLRSWASDPGRSGAAVFTEPVLQFVKRRTTTSNLRINVGFDLELHPDNPTEAKHPYWVPFEVSPEHLLAFAAELEADLAHFPPRDSAGAQTGRL